MSSQHAKLRLDCRVLVIVIVPECASIWLFKSLLVKCVWKHFFLGVYCAVNVQMLPNLVQDWMYQYGIREYTVGSHSWGCLTVVLDEAL